jgi:hypothetical protein
MTTKASAQADASEANVKQPPVAAEGSDAEIDRAVRRSVGIAALRRIRMIVDAENAQDAVQAIWARRLSWAFAAAAVLTLVWLVR